MKNIAVFSRVGAFCAVLSFLIVASGELRAQAPTENSPAKAAASPEELTQAELLKSYLQARDQLVATQLAIANQRAEAEAQARAQTAAIAEKLETIKSSMEAERQRQQVETLRMNAERERQQIETQRSNRTVLWVAVGFGALGLIAMLFMPVIQWRAINRMAEINASRSLVPSPQSLLPADTDTFPAHAVTLSNQRMMAVIERMEKRILELEHTAAPVTATQVASTESPSAPNGGEHSSPQSNGTPITIVDLPSRSAMAAGEDDARVTVLLGKGKFLLSTNKAREAITCYDEVLMLRPNHSEALVKKGAALERLKQDDAAIRCYEQAIASNRKMTLAYLSKAGICNRLGRYEEAMECYEQALEMEETK